MPINTVIREKRRALGMTQEQVAACLKISAPAVNKWERGTTMPDITLLPVLARLLKIDMNELFGFQENLTEQEIGLFLNEISQVVSEQGIEEGFAMAGEKLREFPNCDALFHSLAMTMDGCMIMSGLSPEEKEVYAERILRWYERAAMSSDADIRNSANFMLASKYLNEDRLDRAQELIALLPEKQAPDKRNLRMRLLEKQNKYEEAAEIAQKKLLGVVNELQMVLIQLAELELAAGAPDRALAAAETSRQSAQLFDLWEYNQYVALLELALEQKDVSHSMEYLDALLGAAFIPWDCSASPLYSRISAKTSERANEFILPPVLAELKSSAKYDFLREDSRFQELLNKYTQN